MDTTVAGFVITYDRTKIMDFPKTVVVSTQIEMYVPVPTGEEIAMLALLNEFKVLLALPDL